MVQTEHVNAWNTINGITRREYFAAMAMQGLLAANNEYTFGDANVPYSPTIAENAICYADELIRQLDFKTESDADFAASLKA